MIPLCPGASFCPEAKTGADVVPLTNTKALHKADGSNRFLPEAEVTRGKRSGSRIFSVSKVSMGIGAEKISVFSSSKKKNSPSSYTNWKSQPTPSNFDLHGWLSKIKSFYSR